MNHFNSILLGCLGRCALARSLRSNSRALIYIYKYGTLSEAWPPYCSIRHNNCLINRFVHNFICCRALVFFHFFYSPFFPFFRAACIRKYLRAHTHTGNSACAIVFAFLSFRCATTIKGHIRFSMLDIDTILSKTFFCRK